MTALYCLKFLQKKLMYLTAFLTKPMDKSSTTTKLSTRTILAISLASLAVMALLAVGLAVSSDRNNSKNQVVNFYRTDGDLWAEQVVKDSSKQGILLALTVENNYSKKI